MLARMMLDNIEKYFFLSLILGLRIFLKKRKNYHLPHDIFFSL